MEIERAIKSKILSDFITKAYLDIRTLMEIKNSFKKNYPKSVQLQQFFNEKTYETMKMEIENLKYTKKYKPELFSYSKASLKSELYNVFDSEEFKSLIAFITDKKIKYFEGNAVKFEHKDYTLLQENKRSFLHIGLVFTDNWDEKSGGYISYVKDNEEALRIIPKGNSLF